jgi:hypothetical protein
LSEVARVKYLKGCFLCEIAPLKSLIIEANNKSIRLIPFKG